MRKWIYFIVLLVVAGAIAYGVYEHRAWWGSSGAGGSVPTDITNSELQPAHLSWSEVSRPQDGFSIDMPSEAAEIQIPAYNAQGAAEQVEMLVATPNAETTYALAWDENPPVERASGGVVERMLNTARNGAMARTQTTLVSESSGAYLGYPARSFSARNANGGLIDARLVLAGARLYMMIVAFPAQSARRDEDVNHFFDSLKLTSTAR